MHSGDVIIEIFNPNGKKEEMFLLEHQRASTPQTRPGLSCNTSSSLNKTINSPETGDWLIKITPEKFNGTINVSVAQFIKPTVDE